MLAVVAHPDDESFGLGAILDAFAKVGSTVSVLCFTQGEASTIGASGDLATVRAAELQTAAQALGVTSAVLRDYPDGALAGIPPEILQAEVAQAVEQTEASGFVVFDLSGVSRHPDHTAASAAALAAAETLNLLVLAWTLPDTVAQQLKEEFNADFVGHDPSEIDLVIAVNRDLQRTASLAHVSQAIPTSVLWRRHKLDATGLTVQTSYRMGATPARVSDIDISIQLPQELPEAQRKRLLAVAGHCTVHNSITSEPRIDITLAANPDPETRPSRNRAQRAASTSRRSRMAKNSGKGNRPCYRCTCDEAWTSRCRVMLEVSVLGSVRASVGGTQRSIGGPKQRTLLARLIIARGRALSPTQLFDDQPVQSAPRNPAHALHMRVSRLRSALPVDIQLVPGGYRIDPPAVQTDSALFESLCERARGLQIAGGLAQASEQLHEALALWRGPAFSDTTDSPQLLAESSRLDNLRGAALVDRIDMDLALGRSADLIPELHALVEENPILERHWGQLMTALYCDQRASEAIAVFSRAREVFANRLGVEPSGELGSLHTRILRELDPESLFRLPAARPALEQAGEDTRAPSGLPRIGLNSNGAETLITLLRGQRSVLLTGPAGIGKTHLLRSVSAALEAQQCLAPIMTASAVSRSTALGVFAGAVSALPEEQRTATSLIDFYARHRSQTVLLVDNVDQLDAASLFVITQLIRTARVPAILTSRDVTQAPEEIMALYDSGLLTEAAVGGLTRGEADDFVTDLLGGALVPDARPAIFATARGNPLYLRELITGSLSEGRLRKTIHGWELVGSPALTPRLAQLAGERFTDVVGSTLEAAIRVAIAGEYPGELLGTAERRQLAQVEIIQPAANGWLRLSRPVDSEFLRARSSALLWRELTREVVAVLRSAVAAGKPHAQRRAHTLALELDDPIEPEAMITVAEHALANFDERLALRAAAAMICQEPANVDAHRVAGQAASALRMPETAEAHFATAWELSQTDAERTQIALARAEHQGVQHHDAAGALEVIGTSLGSIGNPDETAQLHRAHDRWAAVAGVGSEPDAEPAVSPAMAAPELLTAAMAGAISGPLDDALHAVAQLRRIPKDDIELVPGGTALADLCEVMVLSNAGDLVATRRRLREQSSEAESTAPETLGMWEYARGFTELLSGNATQSLSLGQAASTHLAWRDVAGLLPAAHALTGAAADALGRRAEARESFAAIPASAHHDPKVVMLRAWADSWRANLDHRVDDAARMLIDASERLLASQHTYLAAMLAHCVVRLGNRLPKAVALLETARTIAGGGILDLFADHGHAAMDHDAAGLEAVARHACDRGVWTTAADTWLSLARPASSLSPHSEESGADPFGRELPNLALWRDPRGSSAYGSASKRFVRITGYPEQSPCQPEA